MGGAVKSFDPTGNNFLGMGNTVGRGLGAGLTGGLSEFGRKNIFGVVPNPVSGTELGNMFGIGGSNNPYVSGPFSLDPNQLSADQSAITGAGATQKADINTLAQTQSDRANALAQSQFDQSTKGIPDLVSKELTLENPSIMESLNSKKLLDSSAYPTEIARQQSLLTENLAVPAIQRLQEAQTAAQSGLFGGQQSALETGQGFQSGALQRGLSLEDQINNANISKSIGQAFAPQPPSGKAQFGTAAQGIGALAPWGKLAASGKAPAAAAA